MLTVHGYGRRPNDFLLCGEGPGRQEFEQQKPFVGRSGQEQIDYLARYNLSPRDWFLTNICKEFTSGNPDPTPEQIAHWTPFLIDEIRQCNPKLIIAVGAHAARWYLGDEATLETCHGLVHQPGAFDATLRRRVPRGCAILPIYHPALGFYDNDARAVINWDYGRVAEAVKAIKAGRGLDFRVDEFEGKETYLDVGGRELADRLREFPDLKFLAADTEGSEADPYCIQVSPDDGLAFVLRCDRPDFAAGISYLRKLAQRGVEFTFHNLMHDLAICRAIGLDLSVPGIRLYDTMYAAYLLRVEPSDVKGRLRSKQGLKPLAWRWCGMRMKSYDETVGAVAREHQINYLLDVLQRTRRHPDRYPKPEQRVEMDNAGVLSLKKPKPIGTRVELILRDIYAEKRDKDGNLTDPSDRWYEIDRELRRSVERDLGRMPEPTIRMLAEKDFDAAIRYAGRDPDSTGRLRRRLEPELEARGVLRTMHYGMTVAPVFEEMQSNGMPCSKSGLQSLADRMQESVYQINARISHRYFDDRPFNPNSPDQTNTLVRRRGLSAMVAGRTPSGKPSAGKKSIEHLRYTDPAIALLFDSREHQHTKNTFCDPVIDRMVNEEDEHAGRTGVLIVDTTVSSELPDIRDVRCQILTTRTATRRLASKNPNLLAVTKHSDDRHRVPYGHMIRDCYVCPEGIIFKSYDLSQIEMRVLAHESNDPLLCNLFVEGRDIHNETAASIFGVDLRDVKKEHRIPAKRTGFGIVYGLQGSGLYAQFRMLGLTEWDETSSGKLIRDYLKLYKGVSNYRDRVTAEVRRTGEVRSHSGMPRYLPGAWSKDPKLSAEAGRMAVSHKIQGGAQDMIQHSMGWLRPRVWKMRHEQGIDVRWRLQIHDDLIFTIPDRKSAHRAVDRLVIEGLTKHHGVERMRVPVEADGKTARTWGGLGD